MLRSAFSTATHLAATTPRSLASSTQILRNTNSVHFNNIKKKEMVIIQDYIQKLLLEFVIILLAKILIVPLLKKKIRVKFHTKIIKK